MVFLALYSGRSINEARLVAVSADADLIKEVSARLLNEQDDNEDPAIVELEKGRRAALHQINQSTKSQRRKLHNQ
jgi:hypothetical protein